MIRRVTIANGLLLVLALCAVAGVIQKRGRQVLTDAVLSEGFEDDQWRLNWTIVDADSSGSSWQQMSESENYIASTPEGTHAMGCRYNADRRANNDWLISPPLLPDEPNEDGSTVTCRISIKLCSQDVDYLESAEILRLTTDEVLSEDELRASLSQFEVRESMVHVLASWETWTEDIPVQYNPPFYYYAVRCLSEDRYILLVDQVVGTNLEVVASGSYFRESRYDLTAFGAIPADSYLVKTVELWNVGETALNLRIDAVPDFSGAFWIEHSGTQLVGPDGDTDEFVQISANSSVELDVNVLASFTLDDVTYSNTGVQIDSLVFAIVEQKTIDLRDTSFVPDWIGIVDTVSTTDTTQTLKVISSYDRLSFSALPWEEESDFYRWYQNCEADTSEQALAGWQQNSLSQTGWSIGEYVSSINFTVPYHSQFFFINSDAQGSLYNDRSAVEQSDTLFAPMTALVNAEADNALFLGYSLYYAEGYGSRVDVLGRARSNNPWTLLDLPEPTEEWECRSATLSALSATDSVQVAIVYHGQWSYGIAIDDLVLLQGDEELPSESTPLPSVPRTPEIAISVYPNPFNPTTVISYLAPTTGTLKLSVHNLLGQTVIQDPQRYVRSGETHFTLNMDAYAAGIYFLRFELVPADGGAATTQIRKVTLLR